MKRFQSFGMTGNITDILSFVGQETAAEATQLEDPTQSDCWGALAMDEDTGPTDAAFISRDGDN